MATTKLVSCSLVLGRAAVSEEVAFPLLTPTHIPLANRSHGQAQGQRGAKYPSLTGAGSGGMGTVDRSSKF